MLKHILLISFILLCPKINFGQAAVDIEIKIRDSTGIFQRLWFGLDLEATDGIDPQLGESDLPPCPPGNHFDVRWWLPPFSGVLSSIRDYRAPGNPPAFPFTGTKQYSLKFQTLDYPVTINWDLPPEIASTSRIQDVFGGVIINKVFAGTDSVVVTNPGIGQLNIFVDYNNIGGDPNGPIFGISPSELNFPQNIIGSDTTLPVTVTNYGLANTLTISNIVSSNEFFAIVPNIFPINIAPLASQIFQVTNTATINPQLGTIEFTHNAYGSPTNLNVSAPPGFQPGPTFTISSSSLIFPQLSVGTVDSLPITISNFGYLNTLYINEIISTNSYFNILPNAVPIAIEPLSTQTFFVIYTSAPEIQQGTIEFIHNAPGSPSVLNVSSVPSQAEFSIYPASRLFGSPPSTQRFWITNTGDFDSLIISGIISSNSNYSISPNSFPISISPGSMVEIFVTLNNSSGFQFGIIEFIDNASGSPHQVFVSNQLLSPQVEAILVIEGNVSSQTLLFGVDSLATDGIDQIIGENDIPPPPPPGAFDARFTLPENNYSGSLNSVKDYRYSYPPYQGQKEYRLSYQPEFSGGIEINWDLPPGITGVLQDIITGTLINVPISGTGSFIVPDPIAFNKLKMLIYFFIPPISVELVSLNATLSKNSVKLDWTTATETNNQGFEILRRTQNDNEWEKIGFVPGFGTTTEPKSYSFTDPDIVGTTGNYKYRLKQIDFDGSFEYSNEIEVEVDFTPKEFVLYQNYPNPFNPTTKIKYSIPTPPSSSPLLKGRNEVGFVSLKVYDVLGNEVATLVNEEKQPGVYEVEFDSHSDEGQNLSSGIYFYTLKAGNFISIKKMVLLR